MRRFASLDEALRWLGPELDRPEQACTREIAPGLALETRVIELGDGAFCNRYTAHWEEPARAALRLVDPLESPFACARALAGAGEPGLVAPAGFFFLADDADASPRALSLNLAVQAGLVLSLPVVGQDALVCRAGELTVRTIAAEGTLRLNGEVLRWAGSRAGRDADCLVYGNADARIEHRPDARTGKARHFVAESRRTPALAPGSGVTDVGFLRGPGGKFRGLVRDDAGGLDIFACDLVLRCPSSRLRAHAPDNEVEVLRIDTLDPCDPALESAISVGPSLLHEALEQHALHREPSLGSTPLLGGRRAARLLYFRSASGVCSLQLWDARPDSAVCPGVTLDEAAASVRAEHEVVEGCFLDSGKSGKLCVSDGSAVRSLGNRSYLRWPVPGDDAFVWMPDHGRPTASLLVIR